jgi:NitT/TauT family transport system substrate-binding protein
MGIKWWVFLLSIGSAMCMWTAMATASTRTTKLTFVGSGDAFFLIVPYVAYDKGFLKEAGIEFDHVTVQSGTREVAALMGNQADLAICGLQNVINLASRGGNVVAISRAFDIVPNALVMTNAAMEKAGIKVDMEVDERVKRLRGLQIGISSPGASTDKVLRSLFASRGLEPDKEISIKPLGNAETILTAFARGAVDGFVYSAPVPDVARTRTPSTIVIDPLAGDVPEFQDAPFAALCTSRETIEKKRAPLLATVKAFTKAMKFIATHPDETGEITRTRFKELDPEVFRSVFKRSLKGLPAEPLLTDHQFNQLMKWVNLTEKTPIKVKYEDIFYPDLAREALR